MSGETEVRCMCVCVGGGGGGRVVRRCAECV